MMDIIGVWGAIALCICVWNGIEVVRDYNESP